MLLYFHEQYYSERCVALTFHPQLFFLTSDFGYVNKQTASIKYSLNWQKVFEFFPFDLHSFKFISTEPLFLASQSLSCLLYIPHFWHKIGEEWLTRDCMYL